MAEGTCLENRRTGYSVPGVQISLSPPKILKGLQAIYIFYTKEYIKNSTHDFSRGKEKSYVLFYSFYGFPYLKNLRPWPHSRGFSHELGRLTYVNNKILIYR